MILVFVMCSYFVVVGMFNFRLFKVTVIIMLLVAVLPEQDIKKNDKNKNIFFVFFSLEQ